MCAHALAFEVGQAFQGELAIIMGPAKELSTNERPQRRSHRWPHVSVVALVGLESAPGVFSKLKRIESKEVENYKAPRVFSMPDKALSMHFSSVVEVH